MLRHYLTVALRVLRRDRGYAALNVVGLAVGLACAILIGITVRHDRSFDRFHEKADRTFRVLTIDRAFGVSAQEVGMTLPPLGPALQETFPEVEVAVRLNAGGQQLLGRADAPDQDLYAENVFFADSTLFRVFDFPLLQGDPAPALAEPATAVLSRSLAERLFADVDPVGQTVRLNREDLFRVTGVVADAPANSHLQYDAFFALYPTEEQEGFQNFLLNWNAIGMITYVVLDRAESASGLVPRMEALFEERGVNPVWSPTLQPLTDIHLHSSGILFDVNAAKSEAAYVTGLSLVALFVLLIAAFNFMNLATARSTRRAKEVGVRKAIGAQRRQLVAQHLAEAALLCALAFAVALVLVVIALPLLNAAFDRPLHLGMLADLVVLAWLVGGGVALALLAGSYPALVLSAFEPLAVLKGSLARGSRGEALRKGLVVVQFGISVALIIGTLVVSGQLDHIMQRDMGYNREQVVVVSLQGPELQAQAGAFREALEGIPAVRGVARSNSLPGRPLGRARVIPEGTSEDDTWITSVMAMDERLLPLLEVDLAAGRNFSPDFGTDPQQAVIINEAAARELGWADPVGRRMQAAGQQREVVGVVQDFHFASVRHRVEPLVMLYNPNGGGQFSIRMADGDLRAGLAAIEGAWQGLYPGVPFEYSFLSDEFAQLYREEQQFAALSKGFAALALFIACLGLFGLAAYAAEQRQKEIGVRKVLGASVTSVVALLSRDFLLLVAVAFAVGAPLAYWVMSRWLEDFAYRVTLGPGVFALAGALALLIALATVAGQALRAANADPVKSLRSE
jgi:putative ABC transport system permease protein